MIDFDPDVLSYSVDEDPGYSPRKQEERVEFTYNEVKDARWCFDTPGIVKENCVGTLWCCVSGDQGLGGLFCLSCVCGRVFLLRSWGQDSFGLGSCVKIQFVFTWGGFTC